MADFELPHTPTPQVTPHMLVGAASPLWGYFGAAAAGGVAYWWMTRWARPANLEAMFGAVAAMPGPVEAAVELAVEAVEFVAEVTVEAVEAVAEAAEDVLPDAPVGGEAAPISPILETLAPPEPVVVAPETETAPVEGEPVEPEPIEAALAEPAPPEPAPIEATADPLPEPAPKPRVRRTPPANGLEA